jgi:hypothetical protein
MLFHSANLSYWILLGIGVVLFLLVIFSGGGDHDFEVDADVDLDVDADLDAGADGSFDSLQILGWLGFGQAPLMLLLAIDLSVWGVTGWILNVFIGNLTGTIPVNLFGLGGGILIASFWISLFLGSLISRPLGKIFASFGEDVSSDRFIGCLGTVTSKKVPHLGEGKIAQADVFDASGNLVTIEIALPDWATAIPYRGQKIIIIDRHTDTYIAIAKDSSDEDKWLANSNTLKDS